MTIRMDNHISKHLAKGLRTDAQRTMANFPTGEVDKIFLSCVFLLLSATEEQERLI
jgi:hypothetical protein